MPYRLYIKNRENSIQNATINNISHYKATAKNIRIATTMILLAFVIIGPPTNPLIIYAQENGGGEEEEPADEAEEVEEEPAEVVEEPAEVVEEDPCATNPSLAGCEPLPTTDECATNPSLEGCQTTLEEMPDVLEYENALQTLQIVPSDMRAEFLGKVIDNIPIRETDEEWLSAKRTLEQVSKETAAELIYKIIESSPSASTAQGIFDIVNNPIEYGGTSTTRGGIIINVDSRLDVTGLNGGEGKGNGAERSKQTEILGGLSSIAHLPPSKQTEILGGLPPMAMNEISGRTPSQQLELFDAAHEAADRVTKVIDGLKVILRSIVSAGFPDVLTTLEEQTQFNKLMNEPTQTELILFLNGLIPDKLIQFLNSLTPDNFKQMFDIIPVEEGSKILGKVVPDKLIQFLEWLTPKIRTEIQSRMPMF